MYIFQGKLYNDLNPLYLMFVRLGVKNDRDLLGRSRDTKFSGAKCSSVNRERETYIFLSSLP